MLFNECQLLKIAILKTVQSKKEDAARLIYEFEEKSDLVEKYRAND